MGSVLKRITRNARERETGWRNKRTPRPLTALQRAVAEQRKEAREALLVRANAELVPEPSL